ncbi:MAG: SWIM zinc finger family protein [Candidatus Pristimantibacillus sp.]
MITITDTFVDSIALNAAAAKNGRDLVKKKKFIRLNHAEDETLLFGECMGSGKEPYYCSADFIAQDNPVYRCTCPSRQFPCKHVLGLLYAHTDGSAFEKATIPADIVEKRAKVEKREEKRQAESSQSEEAVKPKRKVNKAALTKKIAAQLEGVTILEKLVMQIVQAGIASIDSRMIRLLEEQAKQLSSNYVPGLQIAMQEVLEQLRRTEDIEQAYTGLIDQLTGLHVLVKRSREYLNARMNDSAMQMDIHSSLEERIGHAWQLAELSELGMTMPNIELLQLAFHSAADTARSEYVDIGYWISLENGMIYTTKNYRPFRASKYMKEEDSYYSIVQTKELYIYPGELNPRIRWEQALHREVGVEEMNRVAAYSGNSITDALKQVKNQLKNPLADKHPCMLLHADQIVVTDEGTYVLVDKNGARLALGDIQEIGHPTTQLLELLNAAQLHDVNVMVIFEHDLVTGHLIAQPLTIVTNSEIIRLLY